MRAVCIIPATECLIYHDIEHWINIFENRSGRLPTDIVFPAFVEAGPSYVSEFGSVPPRQGSQNTLGEWINTSKTLVKGVNVWAAILPTIPTLSNELIAVRDQWDLSMDEACIVNPTVQIILRKISKELRDLGADGVMYDLTDIYPNSTSSRYPAPKDKSRPLQNTCFCRYCVDSLKREAKWTEGSTPFRKFDRNPARFVLQPSNSGATPIDVRDLWLEKLDAAELAEFATVRGFIDSQDEDGRQDALKLLRYLTGRSQITAVAVKRICEGATEFGLRTATVIGSPSYDMSTNTNLTTMIARKCADEYWVPSFEPSHLETKETVLLRLLASRGTYYMNATFSNLSTLSNMRLIIDTNELMDRFVTNAAALENRNELNIGQVAQVPLVEGIDGFVGIPFGKVQLIDLITKKSADGTFSEKHKTDLLSKLEAGAARLTSSDQIDFPSTSTPWG
jgi:hypothetical protein